MTVFASGLPVTSLCSSLIVTGVPAQLSGGLALRMVPRNCSAFKKTMHTHLKNPPNPIHTERFLKKPYILVLFSLKLDQFPDLFYHSHTDSWAAYDTGRGLTGEGEES